MRKLSLIILFIFYSLTIFCQKELKYNAYFNEAYLTYPDVPKGYLEAIAWANTHIDHKTTENTSPSDMGMPFGWTSFYLVEDGKGWFKNNLKLVASLSNVSVESIKWDPRMAILAYAKAYHQLNQNKNINSTNLKDNISVLQELTYLPVDPNNAATDFAFYSYIYELVQFLNSSENQQKFNFPSYNIYFKDIVGAQNAKVLSSPKIQISEHGIISDDKTQYQPLTKTACPDYNVSWCSWVASPNYSSRNGTAISCVVMHTVQGSYSGCISWFQNTSAQASTSYVVRSSDGQLTQMVLESDKAWHVGTENPYTIGYEHEGYVEETGWYTMPMYQRSADLTRDICQAYGINTLRMFYRDTLDDGTALDYGIHTLAGSTYCTKISGHQHLPNQTHTDPGPYWTWDTYFKLVNNNPTVTTLTTATGTLYDSGGASANYSDDERKVWVIQPAGATQVTLNFTSFSVEANYDFMYIYDGASVWSPRIGRYNTQSPGTITSSGGALTIEFRSDCATNAAGWVANWTSNTGTTTPSNLAVGTPSCPDNSVAFSWQNSGTGWYIQLSTSASFTTPYIKWVSGLTTYTGPSGFVLQSDGVTPLTFQPSTTYYWRIWNGSTFTNGPSFTTLSCDNVAPTTAISTTGNWKTQDFTATFADSDNVNIEKSFYQVLDYDGQYWGANTNRGFFGDNFDILQPQWNTYAGTWAVSSGELIQSDESVSNSNIYASLNQTLSNRYLYAFTAKVNGTGTNKRYGFHFFCDNANSANRNNSYFVWFRVEDQQLQFYKVVNDTFSLKYTVNGITTTADQWYDFKISYDRITGVIAVWRDNALLGSWTDSSPYSTNGNYISFRTGNCTMNVSELKVYRSRYPSLTVTLGDNTKDIRYQNPNPSTPSAKIKSIVVDINNNLSTIAYHDLNVDWTAPQVVDINDGASADEDTVYSNTTVYANWSAASDANSGIQEYFYCLGTTAGADDVIAWTSAGINTSVTVNSLNLTFGNHYYFSMKAVNNAGLTSNTISSDGFIVSSLNYPMANFNAVEDTVYLTNAVVLFVNQSQNANTYEWDFGDGGTSTQVNPWHQYTQTGTYTVRLIAMNPPLPNDTLILTDYITVLNGQKVEFSNLSANIYPNPFNNQVNIQFSNNFTGRVELQDILGKTIVKKLIENDNFTQFDVNAEIGKGTYMLKIFNDKQQLIYTKVLVK